ncbi:class I SAM-dependent methyltransferase [Candidatus Undinarchaeota archaeon]
MESEAKVASDKHEHYYTPKPTSEAKYGLVISNLRGTEYEFLTCSGLFSWNEIDHGTWTLIKYMQVNPTDKVLDLGCGFGAIGLVAASLCPQGSVLLTDTNYRAVQVVRKNIDRLKTTNVKARRSDLFAKIPEKFDTILTNPPISAGRETVYKFITESKEHLYPGGTLQLVARHAKGGERLQEKIIEVFGNCEILGKSGGFRVYMGKNEH